MEDGSTWGRGLCNVTTASSGAEFYGSFVTMIKEKKLPVPPPKHAVKLEEVGALGEAPAE